jgi:hypothetical protein
VAEQRRARAVGVDLGGSAIWCVGAERASAWAVSAAEVFAADELDEVVAWCDGATVAIDAPGGSSEGRHVDDDGLAARFRSARCAEVAAVVAAHHADGGAVRVACDDHQGSVMWRPAVPGSLDGRR